ncbi:MAG TPA: hydrogenase 3 maturation endopeptidase HyCI [bacterium]|nr:hydrogenase 3 maturation endopeptidase HyCI [bacterium]HOL49684.1 hydrogenase 3 maturation endopeptidase HyCI [bacterium]HPO52641.1 hydrogenase 3 maturation endopeptidase HyCI [bacterium]
MELWKKQFIQKLNNFHKLVIMGIGNPESSDDGLGPEIVNIIAERITKNYSSVAVINCYGSPENFTSKIKKENPTHILIIDSCIAGKEPGSIFLVKPSQIKNMDLSTHRLPLYLLHDYLKSETGAKIIMLGIEPQSVCPGTSFSTPVRQAIGETVEFLLDFLKIYHKE